MSTGLSQDSMANIIGVSKKTYIQLEKERIILKWSESVTIATIFKDNRLFIELFGMDIVNIIGLMSIHRSNVLTYTLTDDYIIIDEIIDVGISLYQHKVSNLYNIINKDGESIYITFDKEEVIMKYNEFIIKERIGG